MTDTQRKKKAAKGEGCLRQLPTGRWRAAIERNGITYRKTGSREEVESWLEEMKRTLQLKEDRLNRTYADIRAACDEGREENVRKYRSMAAEARTAAEAARKRRDAAAERIRELQALLDTELVQHIYP